MSIKFGYRTSLDEGRFEFNFNGFPHKQSKGFILQPSSALDISMILGCKRFAKFLAD